MMARAKHERTLSRRVVALAVAALVVVACSWGAQVAAQSDEAAPARVIGRAAGIVYVDAGRAEGVALGAVARFTDGGVARVATVVAVAQHTASVRVEPGAPELELVPLPRVAPPSAPHVATVHGPRSTPRFDPAWAERALPTVTPDADTEGRAPNAARGVEVHGELSARLFASADLDRLAASWDEAGLASQLSVRAPSGWTWDHLVGLGVDAAPDVSFALFQHATPRLDAYLLRLGYAPNGSRYRLGFGRLMPLSGGGAGLVDGAELGVRLADGVDLTAFAGLSPDVQDLVPALRAPRAGVSVRVAGGERVRGRLRLGFDLDGFRGQVDRARVSATAGVSLGRALSASGRLVLDLADDALGRGGARPTRGSIELSGELGRRFVSWHAAAGFDDPVYTRALAEQWPQEDVVFLPNAWADGGVRLRFDGGVDARVSARGYLGADGFSSLVATAGASLRGRVLEGDLLDLSLRLTRGSLAEGYGGGVRWDLPLFRRTHLDVGYDLDRLLVGPAQRVGYAQTLHLAGDQRFGPRTRASLVLELGAGAGPLRALLFLQVGVRLGAVDGG